VVSSTPRPHFTSGKEPVPILHEAWWSSGPVWTGGKSRPHRDSIPNRPETTNIHNVKYQETASLISGIAAKFVKSFQIVSNRTRIDETLQKYVRLYVIYGHLREKNKKFGRVREAGEKVKDKNLALHNTIANAMKNKTFVLPFRLF